MLSGPTRRKEAAAECRNTRCRRTVAGSHCLIKLGGAFQRSLKLVRNPLKSSRDALAMEVAPFGLKICTLEPGDIRTNWARRAGQNILDLLPDYEASGGSIGKLLQGLDGRAIRERSRT